MNFKVSKKEFLDALNLSARAISSTTPLPSLCGIKILVTENSLILISSDSNFCKLSNVIKINLNYNILT